MVLQLRVASAVLGYETYIVSQEESRCVDTKYMRLIQDEERKLLWCKKL